MTGDFKHGLHSCFGHSTKEKVRFIRTRKYELQDILYKGKVGGKAQAALSKSLDANNALHSRPFAPEPDSKNPLGQVDLQSPLWRYLEALHSVHVLASSHLAQFGSHALLQMSSRMLCRHTSTEGVLHSRNV